MEAIQAVSPSRPQHRRNQSSKSNILKALMFSKGRAGEDETASSPSTHASNGTSELMLPLDHPHAANATVLGIRQPNVQSPPTSPSKTRQKALPHSNTSHDIRPTPASPTKKSSAPKKSKSSTNLSAVFAKMNRSSKDLSSQIKQKDKENTSPPTSSEGNAPTPIWAQFAKSSVQPARPSTEGRPVRSVEDEMAKYTPREYSPSKQRNFGGDLDNSDARPRLSARPKSLHLPVGYALLNLGRRDGGGQAQTNIDATALEEHQRRPGNNVRRERPTSQYTDSQANGVERRVSGSSTEQVPIKEALDVRKRGNRVMETVAMFHDKQKEAGITDTTRPMQLDPKAVDKAFEAMLDSRNVPEVTKQKMRSMTLTLKMDFVRQDQEASQKSAGPTPPGTSSGDESSKLRSPVKTTADESRATEGNRDEDDEGKGTKRSRARSRTFTFSKSDRNNDTSSPSKKHRSQSRRRDVQDESLVVSSPTKPKSPRSSKDGNVALPTEYIAYLRKGQDPVHIEVGRVHKLRILLRNETVAWVDNFISQGGMEEIVGLVHRILQMEWREEHEDCLLAETLLCLKGLCTTERAMGELEKVADDLFAALIGMLFDDEKKGPAEYTTRMTIMTLLFNFLESATHSSPQALEQRARRILAYLSETQKPEDARPVDFVLDMHIPRPFKIWCREVTHVTKEVFWIFLHHLNVVPIPKNSADSAGDSTVDRDPEERQKVLATTYTQRHFPGSRPPVPAAPYIGGVEWDATLYLTSHLDLMNGLITSLPTAAARNELREKFRASGFEKTLGGSLRTCKEKFYSHIHDGLQAWVSAAVEDGWGTLYVREGPTQEEQARSYSPRKSPTKKVEKAPRLDEVPKIDVDFSVPGATENLGRNKGTDDNGHDYADTHDDGWLE